MKKILVAEDDGDINNMLCDLLSQTGIFLYLFIRERKHSCVSPTINTTLFCLI